MIVSQAIKFFLTMVSAMVLGRLLSPEDYGLVAMVAVVTNFSYPLRNLGLSAATIQRAEINHGQVSTLFWVNVLLSVTIMLLTFGVAPLVAAFYNEPRLTLITIAAATGFIFSGLTIQHEALLKRQMRFFSLASSELLSVLLGTVAAITLAWYGGGYWALVFGQLVMGASYAAVVWISCRWWPSLPVRESGVRSMLVFGRNLTGNNLLNYLARNVDNLLIGRYWGSQQLGFYTRAYQLLLLPLDQLSAPLDGVALSTLSRLSDSPERYRSAYLRMLEKVAMLTMPVMVLMIATSDWLIQIILGSQWVETGRIFAILGVIGLFEPVSSTMGWLMISQGRGRHVLYWGTIDAVISITSIIIGLPWGAVGVATSYVAIGVCIRKPLHFWFAGRVGPVRSRDIYWVISSSILTSLVVLVTLLVFRHWVMITQPVVGVVACFAIASVVSALTFFLLPAGRVGLRDFREILPLVVSRPRS